MAIIKVTKKELKYLKAVDFKEGDTIDVIDKKDEIVYTINISFGPYKRPIKTTVIDKNYKLLNCTAGSSGGWPQYIAAFVSA